MSDCIMEQAAVSSSSMANSTFSHTVGSEGGQRTLLQQLVCGDMGEGRSLRKERGHSPLCPSGGSWFPASASLPEKLMGPQLSSPELDEERTR